MIKICTKCEKEKPLEAFSWRNKKSQIKTSYCKECHSVYLKQHAKDKPDIYRDSRNKIRNEILEYIRKIKDVPCLDCGVKYPYYVMDFDHLRDKKFNLHLAARTGSIRQVKEEIVKCEVLCSNCHRIRTWKRNNMHV